jgi:TP901-1 family phage major tail protein
MAKITGVSFLIKVNTGTEAVPVWTSVGGQKSATLQLTAEEIDATDKLSEDWYESLPSFRKWSLSGSGNGDEADTGLKELEDAWFAGMQVPVQLETPSGTKYSGEATLTDLSYEAPHDNLFSFSVTLSGSGVLTKTTGV